MIKEVKQTFYKINHYWKKSISKM